MHGMPLMRPGQGMYTFSDYK